MNENIHKYSSALANLKYCETNVNNNLRMTNWNRARGCKCAHQEDADGCGCSPIDYTLKQLKKFRTSRPLFFARKWEEYVYQSSVNKMDFKLYGEYPPGISTPLTVLVLKIRT